MADLSLNKKSICPSDPSPSREILVKIYIVVKPLKKGLNKG